MHKSSMGICDELLAGGFACPSSEMYYYMVVGFNVLNYKTSHSHLWSICIKLLLVVLYLLIYFSSPLTNETASLDLSSLFLS